LNYATPRDRKTIIRFLIQGLKRLEYRGYDSAGISISGENGNPEIFRKQGNIAALENSLNTLKFSDAQLINHVAIAHTRWATHGVPCDRNAHPHRSDQSNQFVVVHNGIITNYREIKERLVKKGFTFESETDTEVIPKLCKYLYEEDPTMSLKDIMIEVANILQGAFALIVKSSAFPDEVVAVKRGSPMILGIKLNEQNPSSSIRVLPAKNSVLASNINQPTITGIAAEYFLSSDVNAIVEHTKTVITMQDNDLLHFKDGRYGYFNINEENEKERHFETLNIEIGQIDKGSFAHFMLKEIYEQTESVVNTMRGRVNFETNNVKLGGIEGWINDIRSSSRLIMIACGTSYHSAIATRGIVEELSGIPVSVELASDFMDRQPTIHRNDTCIFISQSGETADTLAALDYCKNRHALCVGITNIVGSAISRLTDCGIYLMCGPEIGVASTKAYTSQIIAISLMALKLGENRVTSTQRCLDIIQALKQLPQLIDKVLAQDKQVKKVAERIVEKKSLLVMGRGYNYATCLEGALKIKEISYMHCEGVLAGELKHGPLALVDDTMPILFLCTRDKDYDNVCNAFSQVRARRGQPIVVCTENDLHFSKEELKIEVPKVVDCLQCIINIIPLQLLSYHVAVLRGLNVDQPRNLAKSVTTL